MVSLDTLVQIENKRLGGTDMSILGAVIVPHPPLIIPTVGRGREQSYCIFVSGSGSKDTMRRLEILNQSNDGFFIASEDLKLRGPGDFFGVRQSGIMEFKLGDIFTDAKILKEASEAAKKLLEEDPFLESGENRKLREYMEEYVTEQLVRINL